jgi:hypothetical protein
VDHNITRVLFSHVLRPTAGAGGVGVAGWQPERGVYFSSYQEVRGTPLNLTCGSSAPRSSNSTGLGQLHP